MKTLNILGVFILAPLAAIFFILAIGLKSAQAMAEYAFHSDHGIENESVPVHGPEA